MNRWLWIFVMLVFPFVAMPIGEQYGRITGIVYNEDGSELPGVKLTLSGIKVTPFSKKLIGASIDVASGEDGSFTFKTLAPGLYELNASGPGLENYSRSGFSVSAGKTISVFITMQLVFVPHEGISTEAREEITWYSGLESQDQISWATPGALLNHPSSVARPPVKTVDDILAVEFTQKTRARSTRRLSELLPESEEAFPGKETLTRMRQEVAARNETLLAVAFGPGGIHSYLVVSFIGFNDEVYLIQTRMFWSSATDKWVGRISPKQFEDFLSKTTTVLDCSVTSNAPSSFFVSWNQSGVPMQCQANLDIQEYKFDELLEVLTSDTTYTDRKRYPWAKLQYWFGRY